jgi:hypothetical protein
MNRLALTLPVAALGLGTLISSACSFNPRPAEVCTVTDGGATVSSQTGTFGPPEFDGVNRDYQLATKCGEGAHDHQDHNLIAGGHYVPFNHSASEDIVGEVFDKPFHLTTSWTCDDDPWLAADTKCTQMSWNQIAGDLPSGFDPNPTGSLTASMINGPTHSDIAIHLIEDFAAKLNAHPSACTGEFKAIVAAPAANQQFFNNAPVTLNVQRSPNCSAKDDNIQPVFELEWQKMDNNTGQFSDFNIVQSFDGTANPNGITISQDVFRQFEGHIGGNRWRARARLVTTQTNAPWSDFSQFDLLS